MAHHFDYGALVEKAPRSMPTGVRNASLALMAVGILASAYGFISDPTRASGTFIVNFMYWAGIAQGGLMLAVALVLTKGRWGRPLKRFAEAFGLMMVPMYILLMAFLLLGGLDVYEWSHWTEAGAPPHKWIYFQRPFFFARLGGLLGILLVLDILFIRASVRSDMGVAKEKYGWEPSGLAAMIGGIGGWKGEKSEVEASQKSQNRLAPILAIAYAVVWSVMAVDVSMSLMPYWYTNMFPAWYFMSCIWSGFVYLAIFTLLFRKTLGIEKAFPPSLYHDLGKLTFGFTMFWGYTTFAQYLPIWYGNMTEEIGGILIRTELEPWATVAKVVFMLCFVAPFAMLTSRGLKKMPSAYLVVAGILAVGIWLERFLVNMPGIWKEDTLPLGVLELGMTMGFLGMFTYIVISFLTSAPPLPFTDPFMHPHPDEVHVHPSGAHH